MGNIVSSVLIHILFITVEHVLAAKADDTAKLNLTSDAGLVCRLRIAQERKQRKLSMASAVCLETLLDSGDVTVPSIMALLSMSKYGTTADDLVDTPGWCWEVPVLQSPSPREFYEGDLVVFGWA